MRKYRVRRSKYHTEENKKLFSAYVFEYFSTMLNKWCNLKNVDMKDYLKEAFIYDSSRGFDMKEYHVDFDLILNRKENN